MPAVAGDMVYVGSCAGTFYALDKTTGALRWSYDIKRDGNQVSFHGNPLFAGDLILIGTDKSCTPDGIGHVYAFDKNTGAIRWKYRTTSASTDIIRVGPRVYVGSIQNNWTALNLNDGSVAWNFSTHASNPNCDLPKSPVADETHVYIAALDGFIYSLDATSGQIAWKRKLAAEPSTSLALNDKFLFVGSSDNHIYQLKSDSGETKADITVQAKPVGRPMISGDSIFFFLEDRSEHAGYIVSLNRDLKSVSWTQRSFPGWASERPHVARELVIAGNCRGELAAFQVSDGAPEWKVNLKGCIRSVGDSGDSLFAGTQEGTIYAFTY
ncbi:MAG TPA: PQQ-binding-like beta-propeller repeat protein [Pyrinomonadaceae bacterium]